MRVETEGGQLPVTVVVGSPPVEGGEALRGSLGGPHLAEHVEDDPGLWVGVRRERRRWRRVLTVDVGEEAVVQVNPHIEADQVALTKGGVRRRHPNGGALRDCWYGGGKRHRCRCG